MSNDSNDKKSHPQVSKGNKICPKCGAGFSCEGDNDCWCESVKIHKKEMIEIMELHTDCLCPDCLRKYERE